MTKIKSSNIDSADLLTAYNVISKIIESSDLNYSSAWVHVKSSIACALADKMIGNA